MLSSRSDRNRAEKRGRNSRRSTQKSPWTERTALVLISVADLILNKRNQKMCIITTPFQRRNALLIFAFFFMGGRCSALDLTLTENAVIA
jgi:hypothetical protein